MEESEFKFEPIWVSALTLFEAWIIYFLSEKTLASQLDFKGLALFSCFPIFFGSLILPMTFRLIARIPAIQLTDNALIDNTFRITIDWSNVQNIKIVNTGKKSLLSIELKDRDQFFSDITNPFKRMFLRSIFYISPGDVSINLDFVAGKNEAILAKAQVYWNRYYGNNENNY
jgi:hypothetical protein